jgi:NitT/TauT family transport system permease protein
VSLVPIAIAAGAIGLILVARKLRDPAPAILLPMAAAILFLCLWHIKAVGDRIEVRDAQGNFVRVVEFLPTPGNTLVGMRQPIQDGTLLRYAVASLYRVVVGFGLAVAIGIPLGLWAGWYLRAFQAVNPVIQFFRPISPIAWIGFAVLWYGVKDASAIFLIFLSSFFPIVTGTMTAVRTMPLVYVRSARNFGLEGLELFRRVVFPAALPQIVTSLRIGLGIAWLVIVAAEMIAVESGLGYLILDARNSNYYDRVAGAMVAIGILGVALDLAVRQLEKLDEIRWGFPRIRA